MKKQIRRGVFETNSSSTHSLTMCREEEYKKWENKELLYFEDEDKFVTREDIIKELKNEKNWDGSLKYSDVNWEDKDEVDDVFMEESIKTFEEFFNDGCFLETFEQSYTTQNGDEVIAFGKYGYNG